MRLRFHIILLLIFISLLGLSQNKPFIDNYNHSLYHGSVQNWDISQDEDGVLFFANNKGLLRFDGTEWRLFKSGMVSSTRAILPLKDRIYVGGYGTIGMLSPESGDYVYESIESNPFDGYVKQILDYQGQIVFVTDYQLIFYDDEQVYSIYSDSIIDICKIFSNELLVSIHGLGLYKVANDIRGLSLYKDYFEYHVSGQKIVAIENWNDKSYLLTTQSDGLYIIDDNSIKPFYTEQDKYFMGSNNFMLKVGDKYCVGTNKGVFFLGKNGRVELLVDASSGMNSSLCNKGFLDRQKNLWLLTLKGISKVEYDIPFSFFDELSGIRGNIHKITRFNGKIVVATSNGIFSEHKIDSLTKNMFFKRIKNSPEYCVDMLSVGDYLVASSESSTLIYDQNLNQKVIPIKSNKIFMIDSNLLVLANAKGIHVVRPNKDSVYYRSVIEFQKEVVDLVANPQKMEFYALSGNELYLLAYEFIDGDFKVKDIDSEDFKEAIKGIFRVEGKTVVISENAYYEASNISTCALSVSKIDINSPILSHLSAAKESHVITRNFEDGYILKYQNNTGINELLKITKKGLDHEKQRLYRLPRGKINTFFLDDAFKNTLISDYVWLGGDMGLIKYDLELSSNYSTSEFKTIIKQISTNLDSNLHIAVSSSDTSVIQLRSKENSIVIDYTSTNYNSNNENHYSYLLEGGNNEWSEWSKKSQIKLANLGHGNYTFKVKSRNIYNEVSEIASVKFSIATPWYQTAWMYVVYVLGFGAFVYGIIAFNSLRLKRLNSRLQHVIGQRTEEIIAQKNLIERKNQDIYASIEYARTIQDAILTAEDYVHNLLPNSFIFYSPRDIIGGDFYWAHSTKNGNVILAVADCTGHGVPGAMMSMIGNALLNEIVIENEIDKPFQILNRLREGIQNSFSSVDKSQTKTYYDGLDISVVNLNFEKMELLYSGARHPLILTRNRELYELQADSMPIGNFDQNDEGFHMHKLEMQKGDCYYLFSDGYADQFGGPDGKKFKLSNFKQLLLHIETLTPSEKCDALSSKLEEW
ncbi:MAG: SpoIIE family protein phosphatase, partial [Flavobacteriales bacterium]|nr:SpoIIE family protein phosphatase [Flavobacteriales bacterium]